MSGLLNQSVVVLSYLLIIIALWISATRTLRLMVRLYQAQSLVLTGVVLITAIERRRSQLALGLVAILPLTLAVIVPPLLARATLDAAVMRRGGDDAGLTWLRRLRVAQRWAIDKAELIWLQHGRSRLPVSLTAAVDLFLLATALLAGFRLAGLHLVTSAVSGHGASAPGASGQAVSGQAARPSPALVASLAVSIALLLQGLFTMINKNDIISQIIGLLVVDQGLFLAAVRVAPAALAYYFVLSLFLYVLVTLTILLWVLPGLHRTSASIEIAGNAELRG